MKPEDTALASVQLPPLAFEASAALPAVLDPIWCALRAGNPRAALQRVRQALEEPLERGRELTAALYAAFAAGVLRDGDADEARRLAELSATLYPVQWLAHRIIIESFLCRQAYDAAFLYLSTLDLPLKTTSWDEPLQPRQRCLIHAGLACRTGDWEAAAHLLVRAYPKGPRAMPAAVLEDWFRIALYRGRPEDAAEAASMLMKTGSIEFTDALLQTLVQQGWTHQALALYQRALQERPEHPLLRRRVVALCVREGAIDEARRLARPGALDMAA
jgi:tetratricopeptide (TPR) repeat protein